MLRSIDTALETNDCRPPARVRARPRANMCQSYPYGDEEDHGLQSRKTRFMDAGLAALGIRRLNELLEEDVDRRKKKENVSTYRFELALLVELSCFLLDARVVRRDCCPIDAYY